MSLTDEEYLGELLDALSNRNRLRILRLLSHMGVAMSLSSISNSLNIRPPAAKKHLDQLEHASLIRCSLGPRPLWRAVSAARLAKMLEALDIQIVRSAMVSSLIKTVHDTLTRMVSVDMAELSSLNPKKRDHLETCLGRLEKPDFFELLDEEERRTILMFRKFIKSVSASA
jgi:DNA-binding transcriptional ArsR family regulator